MLFIGGKSQSEFRGAYIYAIKLAPAIIVWAVHISLVCSVKSIASHIHNKTEKQKQKLNQISDGYYVIENLSSTNDNSHTQFGIAFRCAAENINSTKRKKNNILWRLCFFTSCVVCVCSSCKSTDDPCVEYPTRIYTVNIFCCYCCRCGWLSFCIVAYICVKGASAVSEIIQKKGKEWSKIIIKQAVKQNNIHPVRRRRLCSCYLFKYIHHNSVR